jgi:DNA-binding PadR family transcriptional regulator
MRNLAFGGGGEWEESMIEAVESLILDLLEWLDSRDRSYAEVMDAWRTSCPKLPVWEDANARGLIATERVGGRSIVRVTPAGRAVLEDRRPAAPGAHEGRRLS